MFPPIIRSVYVILRPSLMRYTVSRNVSYFPRVLHSKQIDDLPSEENKQSPKVDGKSPEFDIDDMLLQSSDISQDESLEKQESPQASFNSFLNSSENSGSDESAFEDEDSDYMNDDDIAAQILNVALEYVPQHGWCKAIDEAVKALELSPSTAGMFKRGGSDLVLHFIEECNNALSDHLAAESERNGIGNVSQTEYLEKAIQTRLRMIIPYIERWPEALILLASPMAAADCLENGAHMIDEMWYHAGDMATDMSWYSKRAALATVYASTQLYMLSDKSPDYRDTWAFLHRRMQDIKALEITKNSIANAANDIYALANAGITTAQNVFGMNNKNR